MLHVHAHVQHVTCSLIPKIYLVSAKSMLGSASSFKSSAIENDRKIQIHKHCVFQKYISVLLIGVTPLLSHKGCGVLLI